MNFLNDSFKTLKNVLEEKIADNTSEIEKNNIEKLCQKQQEEIELLRKQIFEYQQSKLNDTRTLLNTENADQQNSSLSDTNQQNDSWFWEPDTSTKDASPAETETDLTTIPLDGLNDHDLIEKLRKQLTDRESKVKSLSVENAVLNEKLKHLNAENQELNKSIEELDLQHQIAVEKVLDVKNSLQSKLNASLDDAKNFEQQKDELVKKYHSALDAKDAEKNALSRELEELKVEYKQMVEINRKYELQIEDYVETMQNYESEIADLKSSNEATGNSTESLQKINKLINSNFKFNIEFIDETHFMDTLAKWMATTATKIREMDFEISKLIDENKHIKDETTKERDSLKSELINYEIECSELMKNNKILRADIESLRMSGKLETIMENDDEEVDGQMITQQISNNDDEYNTIKSKLEATEVERSEYFDQIKSLKNQLMDNVALCKSYQEEIENLENEKCNYLFELNELKSEEDRNILQKELKYYKEREIELLNKLENSDKENLEACSFDDEDDSNKLLSEKENELSKALGELERLKEMNEQLNELENAKIKMAQKLNEKDKLLEHFKVEKESLLARCDELAKINDSNLENLKKSNDQVQELQKKLLVSTGNDELKAKIEALEDSTSKMTAENKFLQEQAVELTMQNKLLDEKISTLTDDKEMLEKSLEKLSAEKELIENSLMELKQSNESLFMQTESLLTEKQALLTENQLILNKYEDVKTVNDTNVEKLQKCQQEIQELSRKLLDTSKPGELDAKLASMEESMKLLSQEKETILLDNQSLLSKYEELVTTNNLNLENLSKSTSQLQDLQNKLLQMGDVEELKAKLATLEESAMAFTKEKEGLISLVTTKHNENVQYHAEILRLNELLQNEANKTETTQNEAIEQLNDQIKFLREKCDLLAQNLLQEQNNYRLLQQEKNDAVEMNNTLNKDIERLRQHLLEVADAYTFEQVSLQKQVEDYKGKLMAVEADAKQSATAYTSASIRANQQAETLQSQYNLLIQQRDELLSKLSAAEDNDNKNQAALTNLQIALEIFQRDKESDIEQKTAALHRQLDNEKMKQDKLSSDISQLQSQLQEAKNGLMAAARLSDQLELNQLTIDKLNNEIKSYQETIQSLKNQIEASNANTSTADIDLIKNLIVGYVNAPNHTAKNQILKLISNVLNLSESECVKIGLKSSGSGSGWFSRSANDSLNNNVSITEAFVSFLEKESQPRVNANLLTIHEKETTTATRKSSTSSGPDISGNVNVNNENPAPILLGENTLLASYNSRNSSSILKDILHQDET